MRRNTLPMVFSALYATTKTRIRFFERSMLIGLERPARTGALEEEVCKSRA
jgi:hypothetical protein